MRALILLLAAASLAHAQFDDVELRLAGCREACCTGAGGAWDAGSGECLLQRGGNDYYSCNNACLDDAGREIDAMGGSKSLCCAPAAMLLAFGAAAFLRG